MRTAEIGALEVSAVGLGCNNFGRGLDADATEEVVAAALDARITFFDTASNYGEGRSELFLGRALGERRKDVVIATKFGQPVPGMGDGGGAAPPYIRLMIERSLERLGTEKVDLYLLHRPDPSTPIEETLLTLAELVERGAVGEIGCSNLGPSQLEEALDTSDRLGIPRFVANQVEYSLVHREPERNGLSQLCKERGVALLPYYPLASGLLTGKSRREDLQGRLRMERYRKFLTEANFDLVDRLRPFAETRGLSTAQVAIGWLLAQPAVPSVTPGAMTPDQVRSNAAAADWEPSEADLAELAFVLAEESFSR